MATKLRLFSESSKLLAKKVQAGALLPDTIHEMQRYFDSLWPILITALTPLHIPLFPASPKGRKRDEERPAFEGPAADLTGDEKHYSSATARTEKPFARPVLLQPQLLEQ